MISWVGADPLEGWIRPLLASWGYSAADAERLADSLVDANLRGIDSHGVIRLPIYHRRVKAGLVTPGASPSIKVRNAAILVAANRAPGQLAAWAALESLAAQAPRHGIAHAVVTGSSHFGAAGYFARELARRDLIGMVMSNSEPIVVPHGGTRALLGTNPIALAAPTHGEPLSLDMATSTTAMGRVDLARQRDQPIPADWGVDAHGAATLDPAAVTALLPLGGPKGYALAVFVEILAGVLSGAAIAAEIGHQYEDFDRPQNVGHWMAAIDIATLMPVSEFKNRIAVLARAAHATPGRDPNHPVLLPGEPEEREKRDRLQHGIPLDDVILAQLTALGDRCDVPFPILSIHDHEDH